MNRHSEVCGIIAPDNVGVPPGIDGCILPDGHDGPHKFIASGPPYGSVYNKGKVFFWETDTECKCCLDSDTWDCITIWEENERKETY